MKNTLFDQSGDLIDPLMGDNIENQEEANSKSNRKNSGSGSTSEKINLARSKTHKIFDIGSEIQKHSFTRNCTFDYTVDKKGVKSYQSKDAELKVEKYNNIG